MPLRNPGSVDVTGSVKRTEPVNIVLINGWAMPGGIWDEVFNKLVALPGCSSTQVVNLDRSLSIKQWMRYLDDLIPRNTLLIGWSLGGMLATEYAAQYPEKLRGLCTLQMNPKFVASEEWPSAMSEALFSEFKGLIEQDINALVKRFGFLVTARANDAIKDLKRLKRQFKADALYSVEVLKNSLEHLECMDVRRRLDALKLPQLHIYGDQDQLVPVEVASQVQSLFAQQRGLEVVEIIPNMSHYPCYGAAPKVVERIDKFVGELP